MAGPEPVVVDDLPKRRSSVTRPGGGSLAGLQAESVPGSGIYDDDVSTMPATPEMKKQSSEMQLLESVGSLSVVREETRREESTWLTIHDKKAVSSLSLADQGSRDRKGLRWRKPINCVFHVRGKV